ncbi:phosphoribosylaminoimidazolesuccinocarboxamide synthase [Candidatus Daviesbacteria bacterium]|nr:phosphoribosylaminoimidazolesuccinocarboxamide synthase [Candidatus Daviesbacteria bacterium]
MREKLSEGKTKIVWSLSDPSLVFIESKDSITAGDGVKKDIMAGKGVISTETTANCFRLLNREGLPTHFIAPISENIFLARKAVMIPIESVARKVATGSYLQRYPKVKEGTVFKNLRLEFFYKDDKNHDPLVEYDFSKGAWLMYDAHLPKTQSNLIAKMNPFWQDKLLFKIYHIRYYTKEVFRVLEQAWANLGVTLVDLKLEFGQDYQGKIMVCDVIDNDSWRLWPGGNRAKMLDKQRYREGADLESVKLDYQKVAELTAKF